MTNFKPLIKKQPEPAIKKTDKRETFEARLQSIGEHTKVQGESMSRIKLNVYPEYNSYRIFCTYLWIRCHPSYFTIHVNGDYTDHEVKRIYYKDVNYELHDLAFLARILDDV